MIVRAEAFAFSGQHRIRELFALQKDLAWFSRFQAPAEGQDQECAHEIPKQNVNDQVEDIGFTT